MSEKETEGWGWPPITRKAHYFVEGRSLCGNWGSLGMIPLEPEDGKRSPDDCKTCTKKLLRREAGGA